MTFLMFWAATAGLATLACCAAARTFAFWKPIAATSAVAVFFTLLALRMLAWAVSG